MAALPQVCITRNGYSRGAVQLMKFVGSMFYFWGIERKIFLFSIQIQWELSLPTFSSTCISRHKQKALCNAFTHGNKHQSSLTQRTVLLSNSYEYFHGHKTHAFFQRHYSLCFLKRYLLSLNSRCRFFYVYFNGNLNSPCIFCILFSS